MGVRWPAPPCTSCLETSCAYHPGHGFSLSLVTCSTASTIRQPGESLTALLTPPFRLARRVRGAVESWSPQEVRGWAVDPDGADRYRRIAIHVNGQLRKVVKADQVRADPPGNEEGRELRGFRWCCADSRILKTGTRLDLFDADTGLHLHGSPVHVGDR